jgi:hypothetical protein
MYAVIGADVISSTRRHLVGVQSLSRKVEAKVTGKPLNPALSMSLPDSWFPRRHPIGR